MLEFKYQLINNRLYFVRFCLTKDKVNELIDEYKLDTGDMFDDGAELDMAIKETFEDEIFDRSVLKHNLKTIGPKDFKYLTDVKYDSPLIGVCRFLKYDDSFNISIPSKIDDSASEKIEKEFKKKDDGFKEALYLKGLYYEEPASSATLYSKIDYELRYLTNGKVFNVVKNQHFDMLEDEDLDFFLFLNSKVGDIITLSESDISIVALIQNITNRVFYSEDKYDKDVMDIIYHKLKVKDFSSLRNLFYEEYLKHITRNIYIDTVINSMLESFKYEVSETEIEFFDNLKPITYLNEYENSDDKEEKKLIIKKIILFYVLLDNANDEERDFSDVVDIDEVMNVLTIDGAASVEVINHELDKIDILDYLKDNNVDNINKKYK